MADQAEHWNRIFTSKAGTLAFLDRIPSEGSQTVFLPGAGTSLLVDELLARGTRLVINDISSEALARLHERIGARGTRIESS